MKRLICLLSCLAPFVFLQAGDCLPIDRECAVPIEYSPCSGPVFLDCIPLECEKTWTLDVRVAYYSPRSKAIKNIYSDSWVDFQVEASKRIFDYTEFWFGVSWAGKQHGRKEPFRYGFEDNTKMFILPLNAGIKFIYPVFSCTELYVGAGVCYSFLEIRNRLKDDRYSSYSSYSPYSSYSSYSSYSDSSSSSGIRHKYIHKTGWGGLFKLGARYTMSDTTFLDVFVDYYLQRFKLSRNNYDPVKRAFGGHVDVSGFKIGAGLGVFF